MMIMRRRKRERNVFGVHRPVVLRQWGAWLKGWRQHPRMACETPVYQGKRTSEDSMGKGLFHCQLCPKKSSVVTYWTGSSSLSLEVPYQALPRCIAVLLQKMMHLSPAASCLVLGGWTRNILNSTIVITRMIFEGRMEGTMTSIACSVCIVLWPVFQLLC